MVLTAKQKRFLNALGRGDTITAAARRAGISRMTGHRWIKRFRRRVAAT